MGRKEREGLFFFFVCSCIFASSVFRLPLGELGAPPSSGGGKEGKKEERKKENEEEDPQARCQKQLWLCEPGNARW